MGAVGRLGVLLGVVCCSWGVTSTAPLTISPEHKHIRMQEAVNVTCSLSSSTPLTRCQFKLGAMDYVEVLPANHGGGSESYVYHGNQSTASESYQYCGRGLQAGDCGVQLDGKLFPAGRVTLVTCRVHSARHGWTYASMAVFNSDIKSIALISSTHELVIAPGTKKDLVVTTHEKLKTCKVKHSKWPNWSTGSVNSEACSNNETCSCLYKFDGVSVYNNESGNIFFDVHSKSGGKETDFIRLIVAKKPTKSLLILTNETMNNDGSVKITAQCHVRGSRPATNITWLLDDKPTNGSEVEHVIDDDEWVEPYDDQTVIQQLTLSLGGSDQGKRLRCRADHSLFPNLTTDSNTIPIYEKNMKTDPATTLFVIIGILAFLLVAVIIGVLLYVCCYTSHCSPHCDPVQVKYCLHSDQPTTLEKTTSNTDQQPFKKPPRQSVMSTGAEYAEINEIIVPSLANNSANKKIEAGKGKGHSTRQSEMSIKPEYAEINETVVKSPEKNSTKKKTGKPNVATVKKPVDTAAPVYAQVTNTKAERQLKKMANESKDLKEDESSCDLHQNSLYLSHDQP